MNFTLFYSVILLSVLFFLSLWCTMHVIVYTCIHIHVHVRCTVVWVYCMYRSIECTVRPLVALAHAHIIHIHIHVHIILTQLHVHTPVYIHVQVHVHTCTCSRCT